MIHGGIHGHAGHAVVYLGHGVIVGARGAEDQRGEREVAAGVVDGFAVSRGGQRSPETVGFGQLEGEGIFIGVAGDVRSRQRLGATDGVGRVLDNSGDVQHQVEAAAVDGTALIRIIGHIGTLADDPGDQEHALARDVVVAARIGVDIEIRPDLVCQFSVITGVGREHVIPGKLDVVGLAVAHGHGKAHGSCIRNGQGHA
ncbi:hypothetical protein SDC9_134282 [bioreactor metagenome]|uniref:Uncharacterized protein n=1 Tax=bioreactor metagenome TaxID=1076179 RepID=A0A645DDS5_9ZZZZ